MIGKPVPTRHYAKLPGGRQKSSDGLSCGYPLDYWRDRYICYIPAGKSVTFPDLDHFRKCHSFTGRPWWRDRHVCYIPASKPVTFPDLDHSWKCHRFTDHQPSSVKL